MLLEIALALAMQDSVQSCRAEMGQWVCRTTDGRSAFERSRDAATNNGDSMAQGVAIGAAMRERREAREREARDRAAADTQAALRRNVATLLLQGDCAGAIQVALHGQDIALASEAQSFCQARTAPTQPQ